MLEFSIATLVVIATTVHGVHIPDNEPQPYEKTYAIQHQHLEYPVEQYSNHQNHLPSPEKAATVLKSDYHQSADGYKFGFESDNGIRMQETGLNDKGSKIEGSYSYVGDDGHVYSVKYTADENGFHAHGDHLPTPPPLPESIAEALHKNAEDEAAGIFNDGSYHEEDEADSYYKDHSDDEEHQHQHHTQEHIPHKHYTKRPSVHYATPIHKYSEQKQQYSAPSTQYRPPQHQTVNIVHNTAQQYPAQHYIPQYKVPQYYYAIQQHPNSQQSTAPFTFSRSKQFKQNNAALIKVPHVETPTQTGQKYYGNTEDNKVQQLAEFSDYVYPQLKDYLLKESDFKYTPQIQTSDYKQAGNQGAQVEYHIDTQHPSVESEHKDADSEHDSESEYTKHEAVTSAENTSTENDKEHE